MEQDQLIIYFWSILQEKFVLGGVEESGRVYWSEWCQFVEVSGAKEGVDEDRVPGAGWGKERGYWGESAWIWACEVIGGVMLGGRWRC